MFIEPKRYLPPLAAALGLFSLAVLLLAAGQSSADDSYVRALGGERELFCDDEFVASMTNCEIQVHSPTRENVAILCDQPWEGNGCGYWTVLYDEQLGLYRAYCHAWAQGVGFAHRLVYTVYESKDGIEWTRPNVGQFEWEGSKENNIILNYAADGSECHDLSPFIDRNPNASPDARYKATGAAFGEKAGVFAYKSPDGIHWTPISDQPVYTEGAFDSQNLSFWSEAEGKYVLYYRIFRGDGTRSISRAVSDDYIHWTNEGELLFPEGEGPRPGAQYYVNQILPYYRAKHLYIGFPARYVDNGLVKATENLPRWDLRQGRIALFQRFGTAVTDSVYITSRDGIHFRRSNDVFLRPGLRTQHNWAYGDNYIAWNVVETASPRDDMPRELSLYAVESYATENWSRLRRYSLRIDGFGSVHAKCVPGEMTTRPFTFTGKELSVNLATSAAGQVRVEVLDENGEPIPGFTAGECDFFFGDTLDWRVSWNGSGDVSSLAGKTIALRFTLSEADIYSLKFEE
ncbi:MAG: hypothetical protein IKE64_03750 [Thermoguttaceae bacterium]|nr:hypothetical protein [Thermoguttaceae bacterium]